jgi:hypothetical protein
MAGISQLRMYTIKEGKMDEFVKEWSELIYPLRLKHGFKIDGAWVVSEQNKFIWILSYDGSEDWEAQNKKYHEAPERKSIEPDPARHILNIEVSFITSVMPKAILPPENSSQDSRLHQARHLISQHHHHEAHEVLLDYLKEHPKDSDAWFLVAQSASDHSEARGALENALEIDPENKDASVFLASLKGDAEIITYPVRPDVDFEGLAAERKAEREEKDAAEEKSDRDSEG